VRVTDASLTHLSLTAAVVIGPPARTSATAHIRISARESPACVLPPKEGPIRIPFRATELWGRSGRKARRHTFGLLPK